MFSRRATLARIFRFMFDCADTSSRGVIWPRLLIVSRVSDTQTACCTHLAANVRLPNFFIYYYCYCKKQILYSHNRPLYDRLVQLSRSAPKRRVILAGAATADTPTLASTSTFPLASSLCI